MRECPRGIGKRDSSRTHIPDEFPTFTDTDGTTAPGRFRWKLDMCSRLPACPTTSSSSGYMLQTACTHDVVSYSHLSATKFSWPMLSPCARR